MSWSFDLCPAPTTAHPYVTFTSLSVSPSPVIIPGNITIGAQGTVHHHFGNDVKMVVHMDKLLLGQWTKVPCSQNVGSWFVIFWSRRKEFVWSLFNYAAVSFKKKFFLEQSYINTVHLCPFNHVYLVFELIHKLNVHRIAISNIKFLW